jgi:hypothetical protein
MYVAKGGKLNSMNAGLLAWTLAAIVVSIVVFAYLVSYAVTGYIPAVGTGFLLYISAFFAPES